MFTDIIQFRNITHIGKFWNWLDSILYHTYIHSDIFFVLVIGNWVICFFNPITSIDNANYLV